MLAYVFWHWPAAGVAGARYESLQRAFHRALAAEPIDGFFRSWSSAVEGAPWANGGALAYEDWYLVRGFESLDPLNEAAMSTSRRASHDAAAGVAGGGTAGLYRLRLGEPSGVPRHAVWFSKPDGASYQQLFDELTPLTAGGRGSLWMRQMVLGPTTEFCLQSDAPMTMHQRYGARALGLRQLYPES